MSKQNTHIIFCVHNNNQLVQKKLLDNKTGRPEIPIVWICNKNDKCPKNADGALTRPLRSDEIIPLLKRLLPSQHQQSTAGRFAGRTQIRKTVDKHQRPGARTSSKNKLIYYIQAAIDLMTKTGKDVLLEGCGTYLIKTNGLVLTDTKESTWRSLCTMFVYPTTMKLGTLSANEETLHSHLNQIIEQDEFMWKIAYYSDKHGMAGNIDSSVKHGSRVHHKFLPLCTRNRGLFVSCRKKRAPW